MEIDLNNLTKDQLISLIQVRGQTIEYSSAADHVLFDKLEKGDIVEGDFENFRAAKNEILAGLVKAEEMIIAGQSPEKTN